MKRRQFLQTLAIAPAFITSANAQNPESITNPNSLDSSPNAKQDSILKGAKIEGKASIIDIDKCDGCAHLQTPACVSACRAKNTSRFPEPVGNIPPYFPRTKYEDYSKNREDISRLTPYNWTYIERVEVDSKSVFIPRRCMHCDDPTCQKICPFGVISKDKNNAVDIDEHFCFGGAKCRDVCPWGIPQRQAGVGIYLKIAPKLAGGGSMFKCDMCADSLAIGQKPACEAQCPKEAIIFDDKSKILAQLERERKNGKFVYGDTQNGGTSTFYISSVSFEKIDEAIAQKYGAESSAQYAKNPKIGRPHMNVEVKNFVSGDSALIKTALAAPLVGVVAGAIAVAKSKTPKPTPKSKLDSTGSTESSTQRRG